MSSILLFYKIVIIIKFFFIFLKKIANLLDNFPLYGTLYLLKTRRNEMNKQEFIEKKENDIKIYNNAISKMKSEIEILLDGKPEKFEKENGMPGLHEKFNEIKKIRFEISQIERRIMLAKQCIEEA